MNREGYWTTGPHSLLPMPQSQALPFPGKAEFLADLQIIEGQHKPILYRGSSSCRICGRINGSGEYEVGGWLWPTGLRHYVEEHNVQPSLAFTEFITAKELR